MTKNRKGLGKNQGKGFKNIIPNQDAKTHSDNAKGIKQPQRINIEALIRQSQMKGKQPVTGVATTGSQVYEVDEITRPTKDLSDVREIGAKTKTEAVVKRGIETGKKGLHFVQQQLEKLREQAREKRIKALEEIDHPLAKKLTKQEERVAEIKQQIALNEDEDKEDQLFEELSTEQDQLREIQEEATELDLSRLSDSELKTLAVRHSDDTGFLSGLFGGGEDIYSAELVRRIKKEKEVDAKISEARKQTVKPSEGFFDGFFNP